MSYIRRGAAVQAQQRRGERNRDVVWLEVNGHHIVNIYREPNTMAMINYTVGIVPGPRTLIGGDFNAKHDTYEPGVLSATQGATLANWSQDTGMDFIGEVGVPTHRAGHVIDLTFSNIPFAETVVRRDMDCGSDHFTQVTTIPGRESGAYWLPKVMNIASDAELETATEQLTDLFQRAIRTAGRPATDRARSAPWWDSESASAYSLYKRSGRTLEDRKRMLSATRKAKKREYWRRLIDNASDDADLYKVVGWHKAAPSLKFPPLVVDGQQIEGTREKAQILLDKVLHRYDSTDDLDTDPVSENRAPTLPWDTNVSLEEVERNTIGVSSTSPGADKVTVRLLKACWGSIKGYIRDLFECCLKRSYFPKVWRLAEVVMLPKVGKKDKSSVRSWRPIALLSCVGKGLERIIARRIAWTSLTHSTLSPQHCGALPKRSAMDLVAAFVHDVECAFARKREVTLVTMDVQGAFDALLPRRLLKRMQDQGWPTSLLKMIRSFLQERRVMVRLENVYTDESRVQCGTPQGSPLSPVLYMLYLAELLNQDQALRFGYADDIALYRVGKTLEDNIKAITRDVQQIEAWGSANKVAFAPEKLEMMHFTRRRHIRAPEAVISPTLTIRPTTSAPGDTKQPALRWLGVWFDRKLTFKRHIAERVEKARKVALHIKHLANTLHGPPAASLRKATITCVMPSLFYGAEAWYPGRTRQSTGGGYLRGTIVSTRMGSHIAKANKVINLATRGVLPTWRTTPTVANLRDAGLPPCEVALEHIRINMALRLRRLDIRHPLTMRLIAPGHRTQDGTRLRSADRLLPGAPRPILSPPHYTPGCRMDPTMGIDKETAAASFTDWWNALPPNTITIFSDGSESYDDMGKHVGYGYAIYQGQTLAATGKGAINTLSHVFDAEAIGALKGLQKALTLPSDADTERWLCIDSTSVIWCKRANASDTSQWAFLESHRLIDRHAVNIRWSPGHQGIIGNEAADELADAGAKSGIVDPGLTTQPTISGIGSIARGLARNATSDWWYKNKSTLSGGYRQWQLDYALKEPIELHLPRPTLHRLLALRSRHGDFEAYHRRFKHEDAETHCPCGKAKTPEHLVFCEISVRRFHSWPLKPTRPPTNAGEGHDYIRQLLDRPQEFERFVTTTRARRITLYDDTKAAS
ncbi:hypothetical protein DID88_010191 [Monilinia fructigena]|uniref:RNase H type-1 domain-containing protein n=1 Tax=Monilinia fructigena TaxID=38457 RepID=A0A395IKQ6_9HELO|nr:hypothetical protein DID88_010191 [Monilinia fructigena]